MNFTVCLMNAEYVEYGTLSVYRWSVQSMSNAVHIICTP